MIEMILGALVAATCIGVGYYLGKSDVSTAKEAIQRTRRIVEQVVQGKPDVGVVERPDAHDLKRINDPEYAESEDAFKEIMERVQNRRIE